MRCEPQFADAPLHRGGRLRIAVYDEDPAGAPGRDGEGAQPVEELGLVGVRAVSADRAHLATHASPVPVDAHLGRARLGSAYQRQLPDYHSYIDRYVTPP